MLPDVSCDKLPEVPKLCREAISKYDPEKDGLESDWVERKMGEIVADHLLEYFRYMPIDIPEPSLVSQYKAKSSEEKLSFEKKFPEWRRKQEVFEYYRDISSADSANYSNIYWLKRWAFLLKDDTDRYIKIKRKLAEFGGVPEELKEEVGFIAEKFGGKVEQHWSEVEE